MNPENSFNPESSPESEDRPKDSYAVLGLSRSATIAQIKRAYQLHLAKFHLNKTIGQESFGNLVPENDLADIHAAYNELMSDAPTGELPPLDSVIKKLPKQ